jgi:hypothetical protein
VNEPDGDRSDEAIETGIVEAAARAKVPTGVPKAAGPPVGTVSKGSDRLQKPIPIPPKLASFPAALKALPNWLLWRYLPPKASGGKWRKVPFQPNGKTADTTDRSTWSPYEECCAAYARGGFDGLGFVFDGEIGADGLCYCGVDFDACVNDGAKIDSLARKRIKQLNTYTERSVSGTGFHCIVRAEPLDRIVKFDGVEVYTRARYFTFTGCCFGEIKAAPTEVRALVDEVRAKEAAAKQQKSGPSRPDGVETSQWFEALSPELKDEVVDHALGVIATSTRFLELEANGGNNDQYFKLTTSVARSGAPNAENIFVKYASTAKNADSEDARRQHYSRCCASQVTGNQPISVGTLLHTARGGGANFDRWKRQMPSVAVLRPGERKPLHGGVYSPDEALELLNSHYLIGKTEQEIGIFRIKDDESLAFTPPEQFKLDVANIFVRPAGGSAKPIPVEKFWKEHPRRHERKIVFKPGGTTAPDEFNLWRGFGVEPRKGWQKQRRLLRHLYQVICRRDKAKFKYLIRWLAWAVQHPDKHPGVVIVLKSRKQGTGKSTLGVVMLKIFGPHGALVDDKERLLGRFNDWLETTSFVLGEEVLWAGDHKTTDKLKSVITADTMQIERKFGGCHQIPNRLHVIMTTNHDHAVAAGVGDRRNVVYDISDERACDGAWFDPLYRDLDDGGTREFLRLLQSVKLGHWHPRQILKTAEATEQQRMSGDSESQWSQACINADAIVGAGKGPYGTDRTYDLGAKISSEALREAYAGYCKQHGLRPANEEVFGKACTDMFGPRKRCKAQQDEVLGIFPGVVGKRRRRPWGYYVPLGNTWQKKLDGRLGIKK